MGCRVFLFYTVCLSTVTLPNSGQLTQGLPHEVYVSLGTCQYNIPRCIVGEKSPPEAIEVPTSHIYSQREVELGVPNTLICQVSDFHSTPVDVTWTRNEQPVGERTVIQTQYYSNKDISFRIFSYLSITPQEGDIYSCSVGHVSLQEPLTRIWGESLLV
uniref:rano class II histocompatibility antigen, B alpha chain-like n=1 Tax=Oncorhynchus gorbuscha TaxID=8017 RepID=UPI001EAF2627|nr:rano class II histocompatibility antigen, B alpha chain-like [Oncorhynchus gorbuscha]